jgi:hypothetical protein
MFAILLCSRWESFDVGQNACWLQPNVRFTPIADMSVATRDVGFGPKADIVAGIKLKKKLRLDFGQSRNC